VDTDDKNAPDTDLGIIFRGCKAKNLLPKGRKGKNPRNPSVQKKLLPPVSIKVPVAPGEQVAAVDPEDLTEQTATERSAECQPADTPHKVLSPTQGNHSSLTLTQDRDHFRDLYPPAQRPASPTPSPPLSPAPRQTRRQSTGGSGSTHNISPTKPKQPHDCDGE